MADKIRVKELEKVVVRFSGDSGDGMQLAGNIFSNVSATVGNYISTFPDFPADIRAPQGSLTGVSGFQVHIGSGEVFTPGDTCDVLIAMNPAALKTQYKFCKPETVIITDSDSFTQKDLDAGISVHFDLSGFARADTETRGKYYMNALRTGWNCIDEIRDFEGLPDLPNGMGKEFFMSKDLIPLRVLLAAGYKPGEEVSEDE